MGSAAFLPRRPLPNLYQQFSIFTIVRSIDPTQNFEDYLESQVVINRVLYFAKKLVKLHVLLLLRSGYTATQRRFFFRTRQRYWILLTG